MKNEEFYIPCDGMRVHAKLNFPEGAADKLPILVLIPGLTGHIEEEHILAAMKTANDLGFAVLRAELYGHGASEGDFFNHTVLHWMVQSMRVIDYARQLPFVTDLYLAGHSQGGLLVVLTAGLMADRIKALIPMAPAMMIPEAARTGEILRGMGDLEHLPESYKVFGTHPISTNYMRAARVLPVRECIDMYRGPVCIIHGTGDTCVPYACGEWLAEQYEGAKLRSIPEADHCYEGHIEEMQEALRGFLAEMVMK